MSKQPTRGAVAHGEPTQSQSEFERWLDDDSGYQSTDQRLISMNYNPKLAVRIEGEVMHREMPAIANSPDGTVPVVAVTDLLTGEAGLLIVPALLESYLATHGGCVGKKLAIKRGDRAAGKRYFTVLVKELP